MRTGAGGALGVGEADVAGDEVVVPVPLGVDMGIVGDGDVGLFVVGEFVGEVVVGRSDSSERLGMGDGMSLPGSVVGLFDGDEGAEDGFVVSFVVGADVSEFVGDVLSPLG